MNLVHVCEAIYVCIPQALASGPGALFTPVDAAGSAADIAVKVREDPLFLIKKKEEEAKRLLSSNPVKLKQLQQVRPHLSLSLSLLGLCTAPLSIQLVSKEKHKKSKKRKPAESPSRLGLDVFIMPHC